MMLPARCRTGMSSIPAFLGRKSSSSIFISPVRSSPSRLYSQHNSNTPRKPSSTSASTSHPPSSSATAGSSATSTPPSSSPSLSKADAQWFQQEDNAPKRPSFNSLLFQSTAMRVRKDRDEQKRLSALREAHESSHKKGDPSYRMGGLITVLTVAGAYLGYQIGVFSSDNASKDRSTLPLIDIPTPRHKTDTHTLQAVWGDLIAIVGADNVSTSESDLASHASSEWSTHKPSHPNGEQPFLVVRPITTQEVSDIMKVCHSRRVPVTPYSGGTSLEGHFAATHGGVCIDFGRMDQIVAFHKNDLDIVVQPGVGWEHLNEVLAEDGLFFPPDPGPGALIGGMIGTGCSGTNAYHYGTMREWVLGLTVVLADGTVVKTRQRPRKSSTGYDLTKLFIGSEGTLGLVTEATLKLSVVPAAISVAVCSFPSITQAASCVSKVVEAGIDVAAVELLDDEQMRCINSAGATYRKWPEASTLFFKFAGSSTGSVKEQVNAVQKIAKEAGLTPKSFQFARNDDEAKELWEARKGCLWSVMAMPDSARPVSSSPSTTGTNSIGTAEGDQVIKRDYKMWTTDVAVPISHLATIITETKETLKRTGILGTIVGHVGDGNFHAIIRYEPSATIIQPDGTIMTEEQIVSDLVHHMVSRAIELEGTASGEHGVGLGKRDFVVEELGLETVDLMRRIKMAMDPLCLLNCDKVVRVDRDRFEEQQQKR